ncbi:MAG TPA: hypothetical protein VFY39_05395 [Gammaproteobacteria bacterium]|nr:hypothetical protein [Gammaproteobacteria bacterium]
MEPNTEHREHEEAIAPVSLPFTAASGPAAPHEPDHRGFGPVLIGLAGALLVLAVIGVFFVLPRFVQQNAAQEAKAAAAPKTAPAKPAAPALTPQQRAELADRTETLLAQLLTQQKKLKEMSAASWGGEDWAHYSQASTAGDDAYLAKGYQDAIAAYGRALDVGKTLLARSAKITAQALAAGLQALAAGNAALATQQFDLVLKVEPDSDAAKAGRARAEKLPQVLALSAQGDARRDAGDLQGAAEAYGKALAIDAEWKPAAGALAEVRREIADHEFEARMSKGYAALTAQDYTSAQQQFTGALKMRPKSSEAHQGLVEASQRLELDKIELARVRAIAFERRELWDRAIEQYKAALAEDGSLDFAKEGLARAQKRADLDAKLVNLIENPTLLFGDGVLAGAQLLLDQARAVPARGERLEGQIAQLDALIVQATTPVEVQLRSDRQTEVTLYHVGHLGAFTAKQIELKPGRYTAVGSRDGYRDVRETFTVLPGQQQTPTISVICMEPI